MELETKFLHHLQQSRGKVSNQLSDIEVYVYIYNMLVTCLNNETSVFCSLAGGRMEPLLSAGADLTSGRAGRCRSSLKHQLKQGRRCQGAPSPTAELARGCCVSEARLKGTATMGGPTQRGYRINTGCRPSTPLSLVSPTVHRLARLCR